MAEWTCSTSSCWQPAEIGANEEERRVEASGTVGDVDAAVHFTMVGLMTQQAS